MSWNIQSSNTVSGNKFDDQNFLNLINDHEILCFQEIRQRVKIAGYRSFCNLRDSERSGGVGILFKNEFIGGIELCTRYTNTTKDIIVCKFKKCFFKLNQDIYLVNVYISPLNSSSQTTQTNSRDALNMIEGIINELQAKGDIILCGDFNSRISDQPGLIAHDDEKSNQHLPLPDDYTADKFSYRHSCDKQINTLGNHFLNMVMNNRLLILNGRVLGDIKGEFTCIQYSGCSTVDYFIVSHGMNKTVEYMKILDFSHYSDHKRLSLRLTFGFVKPNPGASLDSKFEKAPVRFIFDDDSKNNFLQTQNEPNFVQTRHNLLSKHYSPSELNSQFSTYLRDMAYSCFKTTKPVSKKKKNKNNPWFNHNCGIAKKELNKATRATSNFPSSDFLRKNYYKVKKSYKKLINRTKNNYFDKLNTDIENGKILNWQQFKRLKSIKKNGKIKFDSLDMENFQIFFTNLYSDSHATISEETKTKLSNASDQINANSLHTYSPTLNESISNDEVRKCISTLKTGKASATDMIGNEI